MKEIKRVDSAFEFVRVVIGLLIAYGVALVCITVIMGQPPETAVLFITGPFSNLTRFGQFMSKFILYIIMGCGMCFIYAGGRFSLLGEGTFLASACAVTCVVQFSNGFFDNLPSFVAIPLILLVGALVGGLINLIPAISREKLGVNELVASIMMNYMLMFICNYVLKVFLRDKELSYLASKAFPENVKFGSVIENTQFHTGIFVALLVVAAASLIYYKSSLGLKIRISGSAPQFARYSGIQMSNVLIITQVLAGMVFGIGGVVDCYAIYDRYQYGALTNYGFDGLMVAVLARKKPLYVPLAALLLAYIRTAAAVLNVTSNLPIELVYVMQAILITFVAAEDFLKKQKNQIIFRQTLREKGEASK